MLRSVDVVVSRETVDGIGEGLKLVNPIFVWQIIHPPVSSTAVVRNHVHDDFNTFLMRFLYHLAV